MDFYARYAGLNEQQRLAVDTIDGPLMVIAGPGTGKTELLSMRVASILKLTDSLPENILCLTYTDSGVVAMRERLRKIIGPAAYKVAIHTFHGFSTEIIHQNRQYFYNGVSFKPASELHRYEILQNLFKNLGPHSPLSAHLNGTYAHLNDMLSLLSEIKASGLTGIEVREILENNQKVIAEAEKLITPILNRGIKKATIEHLVNVPQQIRMLDGSLPVPGLSSYSEVLGSGLQSAIEDAQATSSTKPLTAWKNAWFKKNEKNELVLKSGERQKKLHQATDLYDKYNQKMEEARLFDFDDMIVQLVHNLEQKPELRFNLQEKFLYIMVDEFQDTNLAQMRILLSLIDNELNEGKPNLMVVGDDDQAIYSFQGATVGNIHNFLSLFPDAPRIVLTDNYRSNQSVLDRSREVISLGSERLERLIPGIDKTLVAKKQLQSNEKTEERVHLFELPSATDEREFVAKRVREEIDNGALPGSIAILARRHHELVAMLPYLKEQGVNVNYERRDNVLELESIKTLELVSNILLSIQRGKTDQSNALLPKLLAHPAFAVRPTDIWKLSLRASNEHRHWLEVMQDIPEFMQIQSWLLNLAHASEYTPLERMCDLIVGTPDSTASTVSTYTSPLFQYYFSNERLTDDTSAYLMHLNGLITLRSKFREMYPDTMPTLQTFIDFLRLQKEYGGSITNVQSPSQHVDHAIFLMTAHKSKGLEFDNVFVIGATDSSWGEKARSKSRLISYPENLPLMPPGERYDDRLRLFYVAMTRAKQNLTISYALNDDSGKPQEVASFLSGENWRFEQPLIEHSVGTRRHSAELAWYKPVIQPLSPDMKDQLASRLENYKLNATHLSNFLDLTRGGPETFIINDLLKFPQAPSPAGSFGSAIHAALQRAHTHTSALKQPKAKEDILADFESALKEKYLPSHEHEHFLQRGQLSLSAFLDSGTASFNSKQKTEVNFAGQGVVVDGTHLTGVLDVIEMDEASAVIIDYKTGKPAQNWQGKTDAEKIKLHRYKNQLLFYDLLLRGSRDYSKFTEVSTAIQFVEPSGSGEITRLDAEFTNEDRERMAKLITAICRCIKSLEMPDTADFEPNYRGILAFEEHLIDNV